MTQGGLGGRPRSSKGAIEATPRTRTPHHRARLQVVTLWRRRRHGVPAERPYPCLDERITLGRSTADRLVLHQEDTALRSGIAQPMFVCGALTRLFAADRRHRADCESTRCERAGKMPAPKASIDEETQAAARVATRITSSTSSGGTSRSRTSGSFALSRLKHIVAFVALRDAVRPPRLALA